MISCFFGTSQEQQPSHHDSIDPVEAVLEMKPQSIFLSLVLAVWIYKVLAEKVLGEKLDLWNGSCRFYEMKTRKTFCPGRTARFLKCKKRCQAKRNKCLYSISSDRCIVGECLAKLAKIYMPPPLPCRKNKSRKQRKESAEETEDTQRTNVPFEAESDSKEPLTTLVSNLSPFVQVPGPAVVTTPLIDLARMQNWELVEKHATRKGAKSCDADGLFPLHWAVSGGPPHAVVEALLKVYPSAARKRDKEGSTPLHFATHYAASPRVVEILLKAFPKAARLQDLHGRSPLYHAVDKCSNIEALKLLVRADPSMVTVPCLPEEHRDLPLNRTIATMTPLYIAWARVAQEGSFGKTTRKPCKPLEKAHLLLEAAFFHSRNVSPSVPRSCHFVSAAISFDLYLPEEIVPMAVEQCPDELLNVNENGDSALALVAITDQYSGDRSDVLIQLLLNANSAAVAQRDGNGRSPLQLAVMAGKTWSRGVSRLFQAYPEAIRWIDTQSYIPAFAAAASLEAQQAADSSNSLLGEAPTARSILRRDPYNLLTPKQRELLEKARERLLARRRNHNDLSSLSPSPRDNNNENIDDETSKAVTERLTTILNLLRSEPSVLGRST